MTVERSLEVICKGIKAAGERILSFKGIQKPEYKRELKELYGSAEDELFNVYNAIEDKKYKELRERAGDVIIIMSKIVECSEVVITAEETEWSVRQEIAREEGRVTP
jgi:hypothetical protein